MADKLAWRHFCMSLPSLFSAMSVAESGGDRMCANSIGLLEILAFYLVRSWNDRACLGG